jgi:inner membrane protein
VIAVCASLIADLDSRQSYVGRILPFLSGPLEYWVGHRTATHSLLAQATAGTVAWFLLPFGYFLALMAGWVSHSIADMMTPSGVAWFWPSRVRCVLPGNERYRMKVMGWGELTFAGVMAVLGLVFMLLAEAGEGTGGLIRSAIGDIAAAREQYDAEKGRNVWLLRLEGRDNQSFERIDGEYRVRGPWRETGFLVESVSGPRSVCRQASCDWHAEHAVLVRGAPEITTAASIVADSATAAGLLAALRKAETAGAVFVTGALKARGVRPIPPTIEVTDETVQLSYAAPESLEALRGVLRELELTVQIRHAPGVETPEIVLEGGTEAVLDPLLRRWIN